MSRLTASPFHKPSPFVFPREPISPPETLLTENGYPTAMVPPPTNHEPRERNEDQAVPLTHVDSHFHSRLGRPSISYQNSGFRETPSRPVHRNYRFFVVVTPPPRLINERGQLGHTLASGPPHRLSEGIIMPLFPTMYAQLTAIAKEFNFPSTAGLCLYLHVNENGVVMTPRISDESWHMLWNHLFDIPSVPRGPPIGGRIEFDIDFQQARWYSSWLSTIARDHLDRPNSHFPPGAPSIVVPTETRDTFDGDAPRDSDYLENTQLPPQRSAPSRHAPRKLSLLDRHDFSANHPENKVGSGQILGLPEQGIPTSKALPPIAQEEEPQSTREQLDNRVKSWRAGAIVKPSSLAGRGQTSLEPFNLPNNVSLDGDTPSGVSVVELNLEDFAWSISSAGPDGYDIMSIGSPSERLPSPDMALRMLDDSPPTPSTATSWGAPLSYPPSPLSDYRPPSLDLAYRSIFSPPMTPATATSWGPLSPTSPFEWYKDVPRAQSIHLGERGEFSRPVTPSTATSWGAPLSYPPTPATPFYVLTPDVAKRSFDFAQEHGMPAARSYLPSSSRLPWHLVWPYFNVRIQAEPMEYGTAATHSHSHSSSGRPWHLVWPYFNARKEELKLTKQVQQASGYPFISIYPPVYPHFDLYPAAAASPDQKTEKVTQIKVTLDNHYPFLQIYPPVYPHNLDIYPEVKQLKGATALVSVTSSQLYPTFDLYPAVYPCFNLYPATGYTSPASSGALTDPSYGAYPNLVVYPPIYPHFDIYPPKAAGDLEKRAYPRLKQIEVVLEVQYPGFDIYPLVYPNFDIYPVSGRKREEPAKRAPVVVSKSQYPIFDLYPVVYPHFNLYPPKTTGHSTRQTIQSPPIVIQCDDYPVIRPYPPVYPHFDLYPSESPMMTMPSPRVATVLLPGASTYPTFEIYPAIYPHFSLYPSIVGEVDVTQPKETQAASVSHYPYLEIYSPVYPTLSAYPPIAASISTEPQVKAHITDRSVSATVQPRVRLSRKSHHVLHQEVFHCSPVCTPSGTTMSIRPEPDLRPLNIAPRHTQRRIAATRSPTGPALHRPATPPALPSPSRKLPTPPPTTNGVPRSPSVMEQMAGFRAEVSPARRYSPTRSPSRTIVTITQRASMISPLRQISSPKSANSLVYDDETLAAASPETVSPSLNRTRSVGNAGRTLTTKPRVRDSFIALRRHD